MTTYLERMNKIMYGMGSPNPLGPKPWPYGTAHDPNPLSEAGP